MMQQWNHIVIPLMFKREKTTTQMQMQMQSQKNIMKYCGKVIDNIANNSNSKQICCIDFLMMILENPF
jgi:hypothetical protein